MTKRTCCAHHPAQLLPAGSSPELSTRLRSRVKASMVSREMAASISSLARKWM